MKPREIQSIRKRPHLTQEEFALRIGISQSQLSRIERGVNVPSDDVVQKIVTILQENQAASKHPQASRLVAFYAKWRSWSFGKKIGVITTTTSVLSAALGLLIFIVAVIGPAMRESYLSVQVSNGDTGELTFVNKGSSTIKIQHIDPDLWHTCILNLLSNNENLITYIFAEQGTATDVRNLAGFKMTEGLLLTRDERWNQKFFARPTSRGTFCAYDLRVKFSFQPTAFWEYSILSMAKLFGFFEPKIEVFIRFDGCQFVQISRQTFDQRWQAKQKDIVVSRLKECLQEKYPDQMKIITDIEQKNLEVSTEIKESLQRWPDKMIATFILYLWDKFIEATNANKEDDKVRLLMLLWDVREVALPRNLWPPTITFEDKNKFLEYFLGLDSLNQGKEELRKGGQ